MPPFVGKSCNLGSIECAKTQWQTLRIFARKFFEKTLIPSDKWISSGSILKSLINYQPWELWIVKFAYSYPKSRADGFRACTQSHPSPVRVAKGFPCREIRPQSRSRVRLEVWNWILKLKPFPSSQLKAALFFFFFFEICERSTERTRPNKS